MIPMKAITVLAFLSSVNFVGIKNHLSVASNSNYGVVELGGIKLSQIAPFNQYLVGFHNPFYPQNYPQKTFR
jgi:hypothetical protein